MFQITKTESKALLTLFKDFSTNYNANTLAKKIGISRAGALKILKQFKAKDILISKQFGKAKFYKLNLNEEYTRTILKSLLMEDTQEEAKRWLYEFGKIAPQLEALIIFGSAIRNLSKANDIDVVLVYHEGVWQNLIESLEFLGRIAGKPVHPVRQSPEDFVRNLSKPDPVLINALKFGYILHGYDFVIDGLFKAQKTHGIFAVPEPESR